MFDLAWKVLLAWFIVIKRCWNKNYGQTNKIEVDKGEKNINEGEKILIEYKILTHISLVTHIL